MALILSSLTDRALDWAMATVGSNPTLTSDLAGFSEEFRRAFDHPTNGVDAARRLHHIQQGPRRIAEYTLEFRTLASDSGWDDNTLQSTYRRGLSEEIKDLRVRDRPPSFNCLVTLALQTDEEAPGAQPRAGTAFGELCLDAGDSSRGVLQLSSRDLRPCCHSLHTVSCSPLTPRMKNPPAWVLLPRGSACTAGRQGTSSGLVRFGQKTRLTRGRGPSEPDRHHSTLESIQQPVPNLPRLGPGISLCQGPFRLSGADECLINMTLARQAGIPLEPMETTLSTQALDVHSLGKITHRTTPLSLTLSGNHVETIQLFVIHAPTAPLILGRPWLDKHDPHVFWSIGRILGWSVACHANCLRSASSPFSETKPSLPEPVLTGIPSAYHDLAPVFSKESALSLPPHRPYDCAIDLLPGAPSSRGGSYTTSPSQRRKQCAIISLIP